MNMGKSFQALVALLAIGKTLAEADDRYCEIACNDTDEECTINVKMNLFAGELGYFEFSGCDKPSPTLGIKLGKTYRFVQSDASNYFHPLGFAYYPDGANNAQGKTEELEPTVVPPDSGSDCNTTNSCPTPRYFLNDEYLGNDTVGDFGLDHYEPLFFHPIPEWTGYGNFSVTVMFDATNYTKDIFYFCHIHHSMSGRIKLLNDDGAFVSDEDVPELTYEYDQPSEFDAECGTYGLDAFQLPHDECPERFVCGVASEERELAKFSSCIDAMNCHMMVGMTTNAGEKNAIALFIHQMIPHHQNAVNMAKALLKEGSAVCDDLTNETPECVMQGILYEIVNTQNFQIQGMRGILDELGYRQEDDCKVYINTVDSSANDSSQSTEDTGGGRQNRVILTVMLTLVGSLILFV